MFVINQKSVKLCIIWGLSHVFDAKIYYIILKANLIKYLSRQKFFEYFSYLVFAVAY